MKKIYTSLAVLLLTSLCNLVNAQAFLRWNFNSSSDGGIIDGNPNTGSTTPVFGQGTITGIGNVTTSFSFGHPTTSLDNSSFSTKDYPPLATDPTDIAGIEVAVSTEGKQNIVFGWYQETGLQASKYFKILYSIDGTNYSTLDLTPENTLGSQGEFDFPNNLFFLEDGDEGSPYYRRISFNGVAGVNGNANFKFRIVAAHAPGTNNYVAPSGDTYISFDSINFEELTVGENNDIAIYHNLAASAFNQDWTSNNQLVDDNVWALVPSIIGYTGEGLTGGATGVNPTTINSDPVSALLAPQVFANISTSPNSYNEAGFAEFRGITNPTVAFRGAGAATGTLPYHAPYLVLHLNTTGRQNMALRFKVRGDIDANNAGVAQRVAIQYRVGISGEWVNISGGSLINVNQSGEFTAEVLLLDETENQPRIQFRIMTTDAAGVDEWIGIDDIEVTQGQVLPLQLTNFTAAVTSQQVTLNWQTTNEINVDKFTIESSTDGNSYTNIGTIAANNQAANTYNFTNNLSQTNTYYRLKMIDKDGTYSYSKVILVKGTTASAELTVYPNPVSGNTLAVSHAKATTNASLSLYTMNGALVQQQLVPINNVNSSINVSTLANGNYVLVYNNGKEQTRSTVTIVR